MTKLTKYEKDSLNKLGQSIQEGKWNNKGLVQIIELAGDFLNLQTIPDYCKANKISYNGAKKCRTKVTIFGVNFIIYNG